MTRGMHRADTYSTFCGAAHIPFCFSIKQTRHTWRQKGAEAVQRHSLSVCCAQCGPWKATHTQDLCAFPPTPKPGERLGSVSGLSFPLGQAMQQSQILPGGGRRIFAEKEEKGRQSSRLKRGKKYTWQAAIGKPLVSPR